MNVSIHPVLPNSCESARAFEVSVGIQVQDRVTQKDFTELLNSQTATTLESCGSYMSKLRRIPGTLLNNASHVGLLFFSVSSCFKEKAFGFQRLLS